MNITTKQAILGGSFTWLLAVAGSVITFSQLQENHDVRLSAIEKELLTYEPMKGVVRKLEIRLGQTEEEVDDIKEWMQKLSDNQARGREESIRVVEALNYVAKTQEQVVKVAESLQIAVTRLETISNLKAQSTMIKNAVKNNQ